MAEQALQLAQATQDPRLLAGGHQVMGNALCFKGQFVAARAHFEQSLALYDPQAEYTFILPGDPGVIAGVYLSWTLWRMGFADQAPQRSQEALRLAQGLANRPFPMTLALSLVAMLHQWRRDAPAARQAAEACMGLAAKHGFAFLEDLARVVYGWALAEQGELVAGMAQMHSGVAAIRTRKAVLFLPPALAMLAETCGRAGQVVEGLALAGEALAMADRSYYWMEADLHLVRGTLQLQQVDGEEAAEASLQRALALAQGQEAKIMELRAAVHLARLWRTHGKRQQARQMLASRYAWFSEGFDSVDLREAQALLEELQ
jgi:adenylate cyclase